MSTRSGDLDPGLLWYLARTEDIMSATRRQVLALTPLDKRSRPQPGAKTSPKEG
jgi:acetate kinase